MANPSRSSSIKRRVLIVDDHPVVRRGLTEVINEAADLAVCGEAASIAEALRQVDATHPDVAVIDLTLGNDSGIELIDYIQSRRPVVKILVSSVQDEQTYAGRVLRAGAQGFISKAEQLPRIVEALRQVLRGEIYLSPGMATCLLQRAAVGEALDHDPVQTLSDRELQVFEMIGDGLDTGEIAQKLGISPKTVESHRQAIKTKLNISHSSRLTHRAFLWAQEHRSPR